MSSNRSSRQSKSTIPWKRFWCPLGAPINCGFTGRGFLSDPEDEIWQYSPKAVHPIEELLPNIGPLILCGEPGIGKTTEFEKLCLKILPDRSSHHGLFVLNFREQIADMADFRRLTVESSHWARWRDSEAQITLMIDGVDEGLLRISNFVSFLTGILRNEPIERLRLILTCRSAEWPQAMGNDLIDLWQQTDSVNKPVYELCPLRRKDAEEAANHEGCDSQAFVDALWKMQIEGLATRPVTLFFLLDEFRERGAFPATHRELYERGTRKLADEIDPKRLEVLASLSKTTIRASLEERLVAAQRIAALLLCCGKSSLRRSEGYDLRREPNLLLLSQCSPIPTRVSQLALREVIESALFTSIGEEKFGFAHQTFAECLAAQHIAELPLIQVRKLLLQRDDAGEHVVPQLAELTAWTAGYHPEFCTYLLAVDPTALLRSDVALLSDQTKAQLVEAILSGADKGTVLDPHELYQFLFGLIHPGLAEQLRPYIVEKSHNYISRRIAFQIVKKCRLATLSDELLKLVYDEEDNMREEAANALCEIIPSTRLSEIEPLARGEAGTDPNDAIRGAALQRLIPGHWKIRDAFTFFTPRRSDRVIGTYHMLFSHYLQPYLEFDDLVPGLNWVRSQTGMLHTLSPRKDLAIRIIVRTLENLDNPAVCEALVTFWFDFATRHQIHALSQHKEIKEIFAKPVIKRQLTTALLNHIKKDQILDTYLLFDDIISFQNPADFEWLLDQVVTAPKSSRFIWSSVIAGLAFWNPKIVAPSWDKFLQIIQDLPEFASHFEWLKPWNLEDAEVRSTKSKWLKQRREREKFQKRWKKEIPDPNPIRRDALKRAAQGDPDAWHGLWHSLLRKEGSSELKFWDPVVMHYPGWEFLTEQERNLACRSARLFLLQNSETAKNWSADNSGTYAAIAAVWLLKEEISTDIELRAVISNSFVRHCVRLHSLDEEIPSQLFALSYAINPDAALSALYFDADSESGIRHLFSLRRASKCWDHRISEATQRYLALLTDPKTIRSGIEEWAEFDRSAATAFAINYLKSSALTDESCSVGLRDALAACLLVNIENTFDLAMETMIKDSSLAQSVWSEVLYRRYSQTDKLVKFISERQLADMYLHLHQIFPRAEYPECRNNGFIGTTDSAIEARGRLPSMLASRGNAEACEQLRRLMSELPAEASGLQWSYREALLNKRRNDWSIPATESVVKLIEKAQARLIQTEQDLLELLIESVRRYQQKLTNRMLPSVEELWKWSGSGNQRGDFSPKDEESLSGSIARWLFEDIGPDSGVVVNCEVQPKRGSRTDIQVEAVAKLPGGDFERLTVIVEVKGCWHHDVRVGMHTQLVDGYLRDLGLRTGLYVVGWFVCDRWKRPVNNLKVASLQDARAWLETEVVQYDGHQKPETVKGIILDCAWHSDTPSGRALSNSSP